LLAAAGVEREVGCPVATIKRVVGGALGAGPGQVVPDAVRAGCVGGEQLDQFGLSWLAMLGPSEGCGGSTGER